MRNIVYFLLALPLLAASASAEPVKIVSWNTKASLLEGREKHRADIENFARTMRPDVVVLVEVADENDAHKMAQWVASALGWPNYYGFVTNWSTSSTQVYEGLEAAVVSRFPITRAIEYDASPDGVHQAFSKGGNAPEVAVEERQLTSVGVPGINALGRHDRGTMRVDLDNGLTIFPVHLKSNRSGQCINLSDAVKSLEALALPVPDAARSMLTKGFDAATAEHRLNAIKRERIIGATAIVAEEALKDGRTVVIAGDFNTAFELGKAGSTFADCTLKNFSCAPEPFPPEACSDGDGFDDTLAILERALVGLTHWAILSKDLQRTFKEKRDEHFADRAIDHIAVPQAVRANFSLAERGPKTFGSDHYPISTIFTPAQP